MELGVFTVRPMHQNKKRVHVVYLQYADGREYWQATFKRLVDAEAYRVQRQARRDVAMVDHGKKPETAPQSSDT